MNMTSDMEPKWWWTPAMRRRLEAIKEETRKLREEERLAWLRRLNAMNSPSSTQSVRPTRTTIVQNNDLVTGMLIGAAMSDSPSRDIPAVHEQEHTSSYTPSYSSSDSSSYSSSYDSSSSSFSSYSD